MAAAIIILALFSAVMLMICLMQKKEMKDIASQLREIQSIDTNIVIHSRYGTADDLINDMNSYIRSAREYKTDYLKKKHIHDQMMTNISHDLRTPLTSALGYIDIVINSDIPEEEKKRELCIIEKRLLRLQELIDSFFELSQMISKGEVTELYVLDLVSVIEESIVNYYDDYTRRNRKISLDCEIPRIRLTSNKMILLRVFDNIINNALKHGEGDLSVSVKCENGVTVRFSNKTYISEADTDRVFDEFYTVDISRTKGNTGLGLAIAKQFTEMLGGTISALLEEGLFMIEINFPEEIIKK